jgi:[acyl-carrier-protein] S-malonyltransferase
MKMRFAALFPGQGSQHPGMGKDLFDNFKIAKDTFEEASDAIRLDLKKLCFEGPESDLKLTFNTQPALLVTSVSAWRVFAQECEMRPYVGLGHSLGEYSALVCANALSLSEAAVTVRLRGQAMQDAVPVGAGSMMAIMGLEDEQVKKACLDFQVRAGKEIGLKNAVIEAANFNSPGQVVVSGHEKALQFMKDQLRGQDYGASRAKMIPLAVSAPFHSSLMKPAALRLKPQLDKIQWAHKFDFSIIHNVNALSNDQGSLCPQLLFDQVTKPVLWTDSIMNTDKLETHHFIEFGAGKVLSGLTKKIKTTAVNLNVDGLEVLKNTLQEVKAWT